MFYLQRQTIGRIIVGVILIGVLVAGIYGVRNYSEQVRKDQAITSLREQEKTQTNEAVVAPTDSTDTAENASVSVPGSTEALPATGVTSLVDIIVLGLLGYSVHAYIRSRVRRPVYTLTY